MKRTFLTVTTAILLLAFISQVYAETTPQDIIGQQLGVSPDSLNNIPQTPAEAQDLFLKQAWTDLISKNTYLGPAHRFFISISSVFLILFGENYSLSPTLLAVIILWFYVVLEITVLLNGLALLNSWANKGLAVGVSILLAQIGAYRGLATMISNLVYSPSLWWVRVIIGVGILVALYILYYITKMFEGQLKAAKKAGKEETLKQEVEKQDAFIKGLTQGAKLGK